MYCVFGHANSCWNEFGEKSTPCIPVHRSRSATSAGDRPTDIEVGIAVIIEIGKIATPGGREIACTRQSGDVIEGFVLDIA